MKIWMKVTDDKYELPVAIADSSVELAKICGVTANTIVSSISHARKKGFNSTYVCVKVIEDDNQ